MENQFANKMVSIIMPLYNNEKYVLQSIDSVQKQTYDDWELLVINDCSTDSSSQLVSQQCQLDSRIKLLENPTNSGAAISRNRGLREAKGRWIAFLDSDDLWKPTKLEEQIQFMIENNYHFTYTNYEEIDEEGVSSGFYWTGPKVISKTVLHLYNFIGCLTVMYDREKVGLIQIPDLQKRNDYAMWLKVVESTPAYLYDSIQSSYRVRQTGSLTNRQSSKMSLVKWHYRLFKKSQMYHPVKALFWTAMNIVVGLFKKKLFYKSLNT